MHARVNIKLLIAVFVESLLLLVFLSLSLHWRTSLPRFSSVCPPESLIETAPVVYKDSTLGSIKILSQTPAITYYDAYHLFADVTTDGDTFYVEYLLNGKLYDYRNVSHASGSLTVQEESIGYVVDEGRDVKKLYVRFNDLVLGTSKIKLALYTDDKKEKLLYKVEVTVDRKEPTAASSIGLFSKPQPVTARDYFAFMDFDATILWNYANSFYEGSLYTGPEEPTNAFFMGDSDRWRSYSLVKLGTISEGKQTYDLIKFNYMYPSYYAGYYGSGFIFYLKDGGLYYIANSLVNDSFLTPIYLFYMKQSPYSLPDTVRDLTEIVIDSNNRLEMAQTGVWFMPYRYCQPEPDQKVIVRHESYQVLSDFTVRDQYGMCASSMLKTAYYKADKFPGDESWNEALNVDFHKMAVIYDNSGTGDAFYTPKWYWCAGSNGYRTLGNDYVKYLEPVGRTSTGEVVYIYGKNMPYPVDTHLVPAQEGDYPRSIVTKEAWVDFLKTQKDPYPVLVIKNVLGNWVVYVSSNNILIPGC